MGILVARWLKMAHVILEGSFVLLLIKRIFIDLYTIVPR